MPLNETFVEKLGRAQSETDSILCVGLDPDPDRLPKALLTARSKLAATRDFCLAIVEATAPIASAFKINFAFFEALGAEGWTLIREVRESIPASRITIADAKRGDIGNTGRFYANAVFGGLGFDACTVSPYMGQSSVAPFLEYRGKAAFVLARTSNPDASEVQLWPSEQQPLYRHIAQAASRWGADAAGTMGLVVGATDTEGLEVLRTECPKVPFLVPGVGAQGGSLEEVIRNGLTADGPLIINSSRSIIYATSSEDFADAAKAAAAEMNSRINHLRLRPRLHR